MTKKVVNNILKMYELICVEKKEMTRKELADILCVSPSQVSKYKNMINNYFADSFQYYEIITKSKKYAFNNN